MPSLPSPEIQGYDPQTTLQDPFRRITPHRDEQAAGAFGGALEGLSGEVIGLQKERDRYNDRTAAANAAADLAVTTVKGVQSAKENAAPDAAGFTDGVLHDFDNTVGEFQKGYADRPGVSEALAPHIRDLRLHLAESSVLWEAQQRAKFRVDSVRQNTDKQAAVVEADPTQYEIAGKSLMGSINESGFEPETRLEAARYVDQTLPLAAARGLVRQDPRSVLDQLNDPSKAGKIVAGLNPQQREVIQAHAEAGVEQNMADGIVSTYRTLGPSLGSQAYASIDKADLPERMKDQVRAHVQTGLAGLQAEARQAHGDEIVKLEEGLDSGQVPANARARIFALHNQGAYSPEETATKLAQVDRAELKQAADGASLQWAMDAYNGDVDHPTGRPLDPEAPGVKDAIDTLFDHFAGHLQAGTAEYTNRAADIAFRTGVAPSSAVSWGRAQLVQGTPEQAAQGANLLARMQEASPRGAPFAIDTKTEALVKQINDQVRAGADPQTAVTIARHNTALPEPERKFLESKWTQKVPERNFEALSTNSLVAALKDDPRFKSGFFSSVPAPDRELSNQFGNLVHEYFLYNGGNYDQAVQLAAANVKRTWGVTDVNGKHEIMPYAPESMFPGLTTERIRKDLDGLSTELPGVDGSKIRLTPTDATARSGGLVWQMTAPNQFGQYDTITQKNGTPRYYRLPVSPGEQQQDLDAAKAAGIAKGRAAQAALKESMALQQKALDAEIATNSRQARMR